MGVSFPQGVLQTKDTVRVEAGDKPQSLQMEKVRK